MIDCTYHCRTPKERKKNSKSSRDSRVQSSTNNNDLYFEHIVIVCVVYIGQPKTQQQTHAGYYLLPRSYYYPGVA